MRSNSPAFEQYFHATTALSAYKHLAYRLVETQEEAATMKVTRNADEQALIEELLDTAKPQYRDGTANRHYLIKTAFRYPPLRHGSRFGTQLMPSYYYCSETYSGALVEAAYYRFLIFTEHIETPYKQPIISDHCVFSVKVQSARCLNLLDKTFAPLSAEISHAASYALTQQIGSWAYHHSRYELIRYRGARQTPTEKPIHLAIAQPNAIRSTMPEQLTRWRCRLENQALYFMNLDTKEKVSFSKSQFYVDGAFPVII